MKNFRLLGFRSGKWYKKLIAIIYLGFILLFFVVILFSTDEFAISMQDKIVIKVQSLTIGLSMFLPYIIMCNPFGIKDKMLLYRSPKVLPKIIACILTFFVIAMTSGVIYSFTTEEYQELAQIRQEQELIKAKEEERLAAEAKAEEERLEAEAKAEEE